MSTTTLWYEQVEMGEGLSFTQEGVVLANKSNGQGFFQYTPNEPVSFTAAASELNGCVVPRFLEFGKILDLGLIDKSVLLEGAPGSGKSNICQDVERCCQKFGVPLLRFSVHINAGTTRHAEQTVALVEEFTRQGGDVPGIFILDNADYVGYKGTSRTRSNAAEYAGAVVPAFIRAIDESNVFSVGTSHDEVWRRNKWQWNDPAIDVPAQDLLDAYASKVSFHGGMQVEAVRELLEARNIGEETAEKILRFLGHKGLMMFHYANHLDPELFMSDPEVAIARVHAGRAERYQPRRVSSQE
jgi:hypothetical protein